MSIHPMWEVLGIEPTTDVSAIRRAYAHALRRTNPDDDPAGFARLRAAYERALGQARAAAAVALAAPVAVEPVGADVAQAAPAAEAVAEAVGPAQVPPGVPADLERLRGAFAALQVTLAQSNSSDMSSARVLLDECLQSPALDNLSVQIDFESAMIRLLLQHQPRVAPLLEPVIERWRWRERGRSVGAGVAALIAYADDVRHMSQVEVASPRVYAALTEEPDTLSLWAQILFKRLDGSVRAVMAECRNLTPGIVNPNALIWWLAFFERPHLRPGLLRATGGFTVSALFTGMYLSLARGEPLQRALIPAGLMLLLGMCFTGLWLGLIDWPRYLLAKHRQQVPKWLELGWAPAALVACFGAAAVPDTRGMTVSVAVLFLVMVLWATVVAPNLRDYSHESLLQQIWSAVVRNVALTVWWEEVDASWPMWAAFVGTLVIFAFGQPLLWQAYRAGLSWAQRQWTRAAIGAIALAALGCLNHFGASPDEYHWILAGFTVIVLAHRTAASNLTVTQIKTRHYITVIPILVLAQEAANHSPADWWLRLGGVAFMGGVALSMAVAVYNGWHAVRRGVPSAA